MAKEKGTEKVVKGHLVVFGHSHVWGLRRAASEVASRLGVKIDVPLCGTSEMPGPIVYRNAAGRNFLTATIVSLFNRLEKVENTETSWLLSLVQGNYYNQFGMLTPDQPFDFVLPGYADLGLIENAVILPYDSIRAVLLDYMAELLLYLPLLQKSKFAARTCIVSSPPPPRDSSHIQALIKDGDKAVRPTASSVRLKLWRVQEEIYAEQCRQHNLLFISGSDSVVQDTDGFLRPEFIKDAVHANHLWAGLLLERAVFLMTSEGHCNDR